MKTAFETYLNIFATPCINIVNIVVISLLSSKHVFTDQTPGQTTESVFLFSTRVLGFISISYINLFLSLFYINFYPI